MNTLSFGLILLGVGLNALAQLLLKAGTNAIGHFEFAPQNAIPIGIKVAQQPHILGGLTCYVISVVVWIMALSRVEVSVAYPMLSLGYIVNAIVAYYWFGESLNAMRIGGIVVIIVGVYLVARS